MLSPPPESGQRRRYAVAALLGILCAASLDARSTVRPPPLSVRAHHTTPCPLVTSCLPPTVWAEEATAVVSYTATVLDTPQATWASLAYAQAPDCTVVRGLRLAVELPYG